jgi:pyruvate, orthophosphate dikinase
MSKSIYFFGDNKTEGDASMKDLLGGKGANLAEMSKIGIPVPPGFTISTQECNAYYANGKIISDNLKKEIFSYVEKLETSVSAKFASEEMPLLVSVRSGAKFSMPGMMDTILNLGLNDKTVEALAKATGNKRFALDSYRRFIQMYSDVVLGVDHHKFEHILDNIKNAKSYSHDSELKVEDLEVLVLRYKDLVKNQTGSEFIQNVTDQLLGAIDAVFRSWMNERAIFYRKIHEIDEKCGTAVNIQAMRFGNMGDTSGTGVSFTRNPSTGERKIYGEFLVNAQGEDVVAGIRTPNPLLKEEGVNSMEEVMNKPFQELCEIFKKLETHYRDMQDVEFTIQEGKLWILQTRNGKRAIKSAVKIAIDMVEEGMISKEEALERIDPIQLNQLLHPVIDRASNIQIIAKGLPASPGAATGRVAFSQEAAFNFTENGEKAILVRMETSPDDISGMHISSGILTSRGGMTSHAAVVARGMGKPCVSGCESVNISEQSKTITTKSGITIKEGEFITIDGSSGDVILGRVKTKSAEMFDEFEKIMSIANEQKKVKIRANAETAEDCKTAISFNADGIGLCRTEHMFFEKEKLLHFRKMILSDSRDERLKSLNIIQEMQQKDFANIFSIMKELPVNIRLLDPPLHEFLPHKADEIAEIASFFNITEEFIKSKSNSLSETNPMLGHRGSRLGISYPEIFDMQINAIFNAACDFEKQSGVLPNVEIMLPVIIEKRELEILVKNIRSNADRIIEANKSSIKYKVGTMIEIPRACIVADEIAEIVDYISFGTNDLTQTTLGISRDDAQRFLGEYCEKGILENDPFVTIDKFGVGELMKIAIQKARSKKSDITISVCGEHGGDPKSIEFFASLGLSYVSCSPYRMPIARLSAGKFKA